MSIADCNLCGMPDPVGMKTQPGTEGRPLHRLGTVRRIQGVPRPVIARGLKIDVSMVKQQEAETSDLPLSTLYKWQQLLEVPVAELLVEDDAPLSAPVMKRAQMVRMMKTVLSIVEQSGQPRIRRIAQNLAGQLVEMMPELKDVNAWNSVGQRRRLYELGRAAERSFSFERSRDLFD